MGIEDFSEYDSRRLLMPDGGQIICFYYVPLACPKQSSVEDGNRNVFRIDKTGQVIWQITRVDHPGVNWELKHRYAREEGQPGCIEPFIRFYVYRKNGALITDAGGLTPPDVTEWEPGCRVEMSNLGIGTQWFELDVETGVAVETTPKGFRPW